MFDVVIPVKQSDLYQLKNGIKYIKQNIKARNIIIITDTFKLPALDWMKDDERIRVIDENTIISGLTLENIKKCIYERFGTEERAGWYFQQFIKMAYCEVCEDDCYLLWDADTIPMHEISFTSNEGKTYLSLKDEYHRPYFRTMHTILGLEKEQKDSYIAEHMMIDVMVMRRLITEIECNNKLSGNRFFEHIIYSISERDMFPSGFSEFETYGTYAMKYFPEKFETRKLKSLRVTKRIFGDVIDSDLLNWIAQTSDYMIVTIENSQKPSCLAFICGSKVVRRLFSAKFIIGTWILIVLKIFKLH